ncbi:MAG TPA: hypothetical protein VM571_01000 [Noviherbaspirillum sp.]|nr:hypothetical protein [Noviherbaspirillum sp.]
MPFHIPLLLGGASALFGGMSFLQNRKQTAAMEEMRAKQQTPDDIQDPQQQCAHKPHSESKGSLFDKIMDKAAEKLLSNIKPPGIDIGG